MSWQSWYNVDLTLYFIRSVWICLVFMLNTLLQNNFLYTSHYNHLLRCNKSVALPSLKIFKKIYLEVSTLKLQFHNLITGDVLLLSHILFQHRQANNVTNCWWTLSLLIVRSQSEIKRYQDFKHALCFDSVVDDNQVSIKKDRPSREHKESNFLQTKNKKKNGNK